MIHIVDYGLGNIQAFVNMYKRLGFESVRARAAVDLENATKIILPGVGAFDHAMELLAASGMRERLDELVLVQRVPVLGICVGMQLLAETGEDHAKSFRAECALSEPDVRREGEAPSRRAAEQLAAEAVLQVVAPGT